MSKMRFLTFLLRCMLRLYQNHKIIRIVIIILSDRIMVHDCMNLGCLKCAQ